MSIAICCRGGGVPGGFEAAACVLRAGAHSLETLITLEEECSSTGQHAESVCSEYQQEVALLH